MKPGEYNEGMLRGLDYLLDEARKRGLKVRSQQRLLHGAGAPQPAAPSPLWGSGQS